MAEDTTGQEARPDAAAVDQFPLPGDSRDAPVDQNAPLVVEPLDVMPLEEPRARLESAAGGDGVAGDTGNQAGVEALVVDPPPVIEETVMVQPSSEEKVEESAKAEADTSGYALVARKPAGEKQPQAATTKAASDSNYAGRMRTPPAPIPYAEDIEKVLVQQLDDFRRFQEAVQSSEQASSDPIRQLEQELETAKKENLRLQEEVKNALPASMLAEKIDQKVKEHEAATADHRLRASKSDGYKAEVGRLKEKIKQLEEAAGTRQAEFDKMAQVEKELHDILKVREEAFEALEKVSKEEVDLNRTTINELKAEITKLKDLHYDAKSALGRISRTVKTYYPEVVDEAKNSHLATLRVDVTEAALAGCDPSTEDRVTQLADDARPLAKHLPGGL